MFGTVVAVVDKTGSVLLSLGPVEIAVSKKAPGEYCVDIKGKVVPDEITYAMATPIAGGPTMVGAPVIPTNFGCPQDSELTVATTGTDGKAKDGAGFNLYVAKAAADDS